MAKAKTIKGDDFEVSDPPVEVGANGLPLEPAPAKPVSAWARKKAAALVAPEPSAWLKAKRKLHGKDAW